MIHVPNKDGSFPSQCVDLIAKDHVTAEMLASSLVSNSWSTAQQCYGLQRNVGHDEHDNNATMDYTPNVNAQHAISDINFAILCCVVL